MSVRVRCPACSASFAIFDRLLGRRIQCPKCRKPISLPSVSQIEAQRAEKRLADRLTKVLADQLSQAPATGGETDQNKATATANQRRQNKKARKQKHHTAIKKFEWDITPMVDVAFLLLIFFMLTASFSIQKVIRTAPQRSDQPSTVAMQSLNDERDQILTVQVDESNRFSVVMPDGRTVDAASKQDLSVLLVEARKQLESGTPPKLVVLAHEDSIHGSAVAVLDAGREADFSRFEMVTVEELP